MTEKEASNPPEMSEINSQEMALKALKEHRGQTILRADYADKIAEMFGVELSRQAGEVEPIANLDRIQPDNEDLGIGVGTLCTTIVEKADDIEAEYPTAGGHGRTQRMRKEQNIQQIESIVLN